MTVIDTTPAKGFRAVSFAFEGDDEFVMELYRGTDPTPIATRSGPIELAEDGRPSVEAQYAFHEATAEMLMEEVLSGKDAEDDG